MCGSPSGRRWGPWWSPASDGTGRARTDAASAEDEWRSWNIQPAVWVWTSRWRETPACAPSEYCWWSTQRHRDWVKLKYKTQQLRVISVCQRLTCRICLGLKHKNGRWRSRSTTGRSASSLEGSSMRRGLRLNTWGKVQKYIHYIFIRHLTDQSACEGSSPRAADREEGWAPVTTWQKTPSPSLQTQTCERSSAEARNYQEMKPLFIYRLNESNLLCSKA